MTFTFVLTNMDGKFVAGPFMNIDQVPKTVDWNKVLIKVLNWFDPKYGKLI